MGVESKFIPPVLDTLVSVFNTMLQFQPEVGEANLKQDHTSRGVVTGLMTMESKEVQGSLAITFSEQVIFDLAKRMLNLELNEVDEIARDLAGEMTNIIVGGAKCALEEEGYHFDMSLPKVLEGEKHEIEHQSDGQTILIPLSIDSGEFFLELNFSEPVSIQ